MGKISYYAALLFFVLGICVTAQAQKSSPPPDDFISEVIRSLPQDNILRYALEKGRRGDGVHYAWMDEMKSLGIKQVSYVFSFEWRYNKLIRIEPVNKAYHPRYYEYDVMIDNSETLEKIHRSGLAAELQKEALKRARELITGEAKGKKIVPTGKLYINLLDDERLPILADMPDITVISRN